VALATSAEMLALSIVPVPKGRLELTLGGILGSCVRNLTLTLGVAGLVRPLELSGQAIAPAAGLMLALSALLLLLLQRQWLGRREGCALLFAYPLHLALGLVRPP
jgi:cation:H+ antiporter